MHCISFLLIFFNGVFSVTGGFAASANHNATQQWYVSALAGKDKNPGTKTKPFATLRRARDAVRKSASRQKKPITIWVGEGIYSFSKKTEPRNASNKFPTPPLHGQNNIPASPTS